MMSETAKSIARTGAEDAAWVVFCIAILAAVVCGMFRDEAGVSQSLAVLSLAVAVAAFIPALILLGIRQIAAQLR